MMWIAIAIVVSVALVCECITDCMKNKGQECCCDSCPMKDECWEVMGK